ncbi:MAG: chemotaxis protein CheW [Deltaproteobacteria bacterium]|nr:chemotaxis protein CheW [Deltaproteobacteria bacterium]
MKNAIRLKIAEEAPRQATFAPTVENYDESLDHRKKSAEGTINIISFFLGADEYAFEVSEAVEVLRPRQATEVPWTPAYIQGILSVRGEMVPVLDLKMRLGWEGERQAHGQDTHRCRGRPEGRLLVDRLSGVKRCLPGSWSRPGDSEPQAAA